MHDGPNTPRRRQLRSWSAGPTALAVFVFLFLSHTFAISSHPEPHTATGSAAFAKEVDGLAHAIRMRSFRTSRHVGACRSGHTFNLVRSAGKMETISMFDIDPSQHYDPARWFGVVMPICTHPHRHGLWATTAIVWRHSVRERTYAWGLMTPQEQTESRDVVVRTMNEYSTCEDEACGCLSCHGLALLRAGDGVTRHRVWSGYIHNAVTLALALLTLRAGFVTIRTTPRHIAAWRRSRRGRCAACGYDLAGLTSPTCPECGRAASV